MSDMFDDDPRDDEDERSPSRRTRALIITGVAVVLAVIAVSTFASFWTDRLWFGSVGYGSVFTKLFWTKTILFVVFGLVFALVVVAAIVTAYRTRPLFRPTSAEQTGLDRYRDVVTPIRVWLVAAIGIVVGIFAGTSGLGQWRSYLLWANGGSFGQKDAFFHKDIGFYVFTLPWLHYLVDFVMTACVIAILASAVVHYLYGGIRLQVQRDRLSGAAQVQFSVLLGVLVLAKAGDYWLDRYDLVTRSNSIFTGMDYTGEHAMLPAKNILTGIAIICAVLFALNIWRRTWLLPSMGLALLVLSAVVIGLIYPGIVQQFQVKPSTADKQTPYIQQNINATRAAYGISDVQDAPPTETTNNPDATPADLNAQLSTVPLVDPELVSPTFQQNQQPSQSYYQVPNVLDVDHYDIAGKQRALVLGLRELDQSNINSGDQNWSNLHTVYTHGNGVIAAYANQRNEADTTESLGIQWAQGIQKPADTASGDQQNALIPKPGAVEDRIYYGQDSPDYSVVGKTPGSDSVELNLNEQAGGGTTTSTTTYDGSGGVSLGSTFRKFLYAVKYGEPNFLLSDRVNADSKILYNRDPRTEVEKVAPWLTLDSDPYPVVAGGRITWVLDGYTTTDSYPDSERESFKTMTDDSLQTNPTGLRTLPTDNINYIRNSVKATVDAYDGTVHLYAWDDDPILEAWERAFPGVVQPKADIPADLYPHLRYPEDEFKVQRYQLASYHVTDAATFFQGSSRWTVPEDPNNTGNLQPPYRLFLNQANGTTTAPIWSLTSTFVPNGGQASLAAFISVDSDPDSANYGKITLQRPPNGTQGPGQVAAAFTSQSDIAKYISTFTLGNGVAQPGNLLTIPTADNGLIYVEPLYASRTPGAGNYATLGRILVRYGNQTGYGPTLATALDNALTGATPGGSGSTAPPGNTGSTKPGTGTVREQIHALLVRADAQFATASTALAKGDLAGYAQANKTASKLINQALALDKTTTAGGATKPGAGASASPSASPSASGQPTAANP